MGFHIQLDLKAIEQASSVARAGGITEDQQLAGLARMYHHVWSKKSDQATRELLMGWFGLSSSQVERLAEAEVAFGHLEQRHGGWRIRGAKRYFNLAKKLSEGGQKSKANLKQYSQGKEPGGPAPAPEPEDPAPTPTEAFGEDQCWAMMEKLRLEHCQARGVETHFWPRPKRYKELLHKAVDACGIVDSIAGGGAFSRWDMLTLLFERYLAQERIGVKDEAGKPCTPPWPVPLFLSPGVLQRFKQDYDAEAAA